MSDGLGSEWLQRQIATGEAGDILRPAMNISTQTSDVRRFGFNLTGAFELLNEHFTPLVAQPGEMRNAERLGKFVLLAVQLIDGQ